MVCSFPLKKLSTCHFLEQPLLLVRQSAKMSKMVFVNFLADQRLLFQKRVCNHYFNEYEQIILMFKKFNTKI